MDFDRGVLVAFVALLLILSTTLVLPYLQFVLAAVLLAFALSPLQTRLERRVGKSPAAAILVALSTVAIILPIVGLLWYVASDAARWAQNLQEMEFQFQPIEERIAAYTGREVDIAGTINAAAQNAADSSLGGAVSIFETLTHLLLGLAVLLFLLFYFLRDGDRLVDWLRDTLPLPAAVTRDLLRRTDRLARAVLVGHVLVAIVQAVLAGIGLWAVGISNAAFWTFVMVILGLIPLIGTFVVWAPAAVVLFLDGAVMSAVALVLYGSIVVGFSDEWLRPVLVDRYAEVNPSIILIGVVGGLSVWGFMGLFVGPIVIGLLKEAVEIYDEHYEEGATPVVG